MVELVGCKTKPGPVQLNDPVVKGAENTKSVIMRTLIILLFILAGSLVYGQKKNAPKKTVDVTKIELRGSSRTTQLTRKDNLHKRQSFTKKGTNYQLKSNRFSQGAAQNKTQAKKSQQQRDLQKQAQVKKQQQLNTQKQNEALKKRQIKRQQRLLQLKNKLP